MRKKMYWIEQAQQNAENSMYLFTTETGFLVQQIKSALNIFPFTRNLFAAEKIKKFQDIKLRLTEQERPHSKIP